MSRAPLLVEPPQLVGVGSVSQLVESKASFHYLFYRLVPSFPYRLVPGFPSPFPRLSPDLVIRPISPIAPIGLIFVPQTIMTATRYAMSHLLFEPAEAPHVICRYDDLG